MRLLDHSFATPAENLACDEALLEELDEGIGEPTLRFWESPVPFVVVGYANQVLSEVNLNECTRMGIPVLRRSSGGGTVLQGPGCLNFNLTFPIANETATITDTNCYIMRRHREAFRKLLARDDVEIQGHTDLTLGPKKFSGNAQRRKRDALVFHGCFLLNFDLGLIARFLNHPTKEPDYRAGRPHRQFLVNLGLPASAVKLALVEAWDAHDVTPPPSSERIEKLVRERYGNAGWNDKF